jgi:hypothetical protein
MTRSAKIGNSVKKGWRVKMPLSRVKRYRAVAEVYRNRVPQFDDHLMLTACGLWNFYLSAA